MITLLSRLFIPDYENYSSPKVRQAYGILTGSVGIFFNFFLFVLKIVAGMISHSIAITADAFNNLSDSASCVVTLFGCKMAAKPADKDHPFGHGRAEYLTSLIIAVIIILVGFELLRSSAGKIVSPDEVKFSAAALISLFASIGVKLWMSVFNTKLGKRINSPVMMATAQDSRSDVIATSAAVIGLTASLFTTLPIDGAMGIVVSIFIIKGGFGIVKDTVDDLIGKPADHELIKKIEDIVTAPDKIIGVHDLVVHDYGPGKKLASCHAEVRSDENFVAAHDVIDSIERDIFKKLGIMMTIHMDPVDVDNEQTNACRKAVEEYAAQLDPRLRIHDFRLVPGDTHTNLVFDIVVPYDCKYSESELKEKLSQLMNASKDTRYYLVITIDRDFSEE